MASEALTRVMEAVAQSMSTANTALIKEQELRPGIRYIVSELEISVPISRLAVLDSGDVAIDLTGEDANVAGQYVRFKIQPVPETLVATAGRPEKPREVPDIKRRALAEGLMALLESGYDLDKVLVTYDPDSDAPVGSVARYEVKGRGREPAEQEVILTIAGRPPGERDGPRELPDDLIAVEGIGKRYAEKLVDAGIKSAAALRDAGGTARGSRKLAKATGISQKLIERWVNLVELATIEGIGPEYADLLEAQGVRSLSALAAQDPPDLHRKLVAFNEKARKVRKLPNEAQLRDWIGQAKEASRNTGS